jgi:hypothetical protein
MKSILLNKILIECKKKKKNKEKKNKDKLN